MQKRRSTVKRSYKVHTGTKVIEREYSYIPSRYIAAVMITLFEVLAVIASVVVCCYYIPYFYIAQKLPRNPDTSFKNGTVPNAERCLF